MKLSMGGRRSSALPVRISLADVQGSASDLGDSVRKSRTRIPRPSMGRRSASEEAKLRSTAERNAIQPKFRRSRSNLGLTTPQSCRQPPRAFGSGVLGNAPSSECGKSVQQQDVRPLADKQWQATQMNKIQHFLQQTSNGPSFLNAGRSLRPMTLKIFIESCKLLVNMVIPRTCIDNANYVEELPIILRKMGYPVKVTKSLLLSVNIPRNWPSVLGILSYLVEYVQTFIEDPICVENEDDWITRDTVKECYNRYLAGEEYAHIWTKKLRERMEVEALEVQKLDREVQELEKISQQLAEIEKNRIENENQQLALKHNMQFEERNISKLRESLEQIRAKIVKKTHTLKAKKNHHDELLELIALLSDEIKNTVADREDRQRKLDECSELEEQIESFNKLLADLADYSCQEDLKLTTSRNKVREAADKYNRQCLSYSVNFPEMNALAVYDLRPIDPDTLPKLLQLHQTIQEKLLATQKENVELEQRNTDDANLCTQLSETAAEKQRHFKTLKSQHTYLLEELDRLKNEKRKLMAEHKLQKQIYDDEFKKIHINESDVQSKVTQLENKLREYNVMSETLKKQAQDYFAAHNSLVKSYMDEVAKRIKAVTTETESLNSAFKVVGVKK